MQCNLPTGQGACSGHLDSGPQPGLLLAPLMDTHPRIQAPYRRWLSPASSHCKAMSRDKDRCHLNQTFPDEILTSEYFTSSNPTGGSLAGEVLTLRFCISVNQILLVLLHFHFSLLMPII